MAPTVAVQHVANELRKEAIEMLNEAATSDFGTRRIAEAFTRLADRLERTGSTWGPRTPTSAQPAPEISQEGHDPRRGDYLLTRAIEDRLLQVQRQSNITMPKRMPRELALDLVDIIKAVLHRHPGPEIVVTYPSAVNATLVELKRVLGGRLHNDARATQLLDDAIELSS